MSQTSFRTGLGLASAFGARPSFTCAVRNGAVSAVWVQLGGRLDPVGARRLDHALRAAQLRARVVVVDLRGLAFLDRAGLRVIRGGALRARRFGRRMIAVRSPDQRGMLTLTRISNDVQIVELDPAQPPVQALLHLA